MAKFTIQEVLNATQGRLIGTPRDVIVERVWTDSRTIRDGDLFVALVGDRFNGHHFVREALAAGAVGVVLSNTGSLPYERAEDVLFRDALLVKVVNTQQALLGLSRFHRERFQIPVVGITGSNGKTTTKEFTAAVLQGRGPVLKTTGNYNNQVGVPLTLFGLLPEHRSAVVEMGINHWGELKRLCDAALPSIGVITCIAPAHLEGLRDIAGVVAGKGELLEKLQEGATAILNRDDAQYEALRAKARGPVVTFGRHAEADVRAEDLSIDSEARTRFRLIVSPGLSARSPETRQIALLLGSPDDAGGRAESVSLHFPGTHNVSNALAAAAAGAVLGLTVGEIRAGLESVHPWGMRSRIETVGKIRIYNDAYNANPASMKAALETLAEMKRGGRAIAVLGEMFELGADAARAHEEVGRHAAESGVDLLITVGELGESIRRGALLGGMPESSSVACREIAEARNAVRERAKEEDIILIKGSRRAGMERVVEGLFDGPRPSESGG